MLLSTRARLSCLTLLCAAAFPISFAHAEGAGDKSDPLVERRETKTWLHRIQNAANKGSYQGTVVVSSSNTPAISRIAHYCEGPDQFERIDSLDGHGRHVVRHNDQVHTVWPKRRVAMVERRDQMSSFPGLLQAGADRAPDFYDVKTAGQDRVAGRDADVLLLKPRDHYRYGYRLWADQATGLLLRSEVLGERGSVLEWSAFSEVSIGARTAVDLLQPIRKLDGYRVLQPAAVPTQLEAEGWSLVPKVPGFQIVSCVKRPVDGLLREQSSAGGDEQSRQLVQAVFSDGITYVTVFIEPFNADRHPRPMNAAIGATQTLMRRQADWWVTLMGDVPAPTLRLFADALERRSK
jgi:sigma-E factor negative regulatory protein RseB